MINIFMQVIGLRLFAQRCGGGHHGLPLAIAKFDSRANGAVRVRLHFAFRTKRMQSFTINKGYQCMIKFLRIERLVTGYSSELYTRI